MLANISHSDYDAGRIEHLFSILKTTQGAEKPQEYEVLIDKFKIVPRTSDLNLFHSFSQFISADTKVIEIDLFKGGSSQSDRYFFHMKGYKEGENLGGTAEAAKEKEWEDKKLAQLQTDFDYKNLKEVNEDLMQLVDEKNRRIEELERLLVETKDGQHLTMSQITTAAVHGLLQLPVVKKAVEAVTSGLGGVHKAGGTTNTSEEATFSRKAEPNENVEDAGEAKEQGKTVELSEEDLGYLKLVQDLKKEFTREELIKVMQVLDLLRQNKQCVDFALKQINNFLKQKPKENSNNEKV